MDIPITPSTALIIVDVQNDFLPGGALAVNKGELVIPFINSILDKYALCIATRDWHPSNHVSFASSHQNKNIGDSIVIEARNQILWPDHCVQNSYGSEISKEINQAKIHYIIDKGSSINIDSYSGFYDHHLQKTELCEILEKHNIDTLHICGLATDYCVKHTTCDALELGYKTYLLTQGIQAVNLNQDDGANAIEFMQARGAIIV